MKIDIDKIKKEYKEAVRKKALGKNYVSLPDNEASRSVQAESQEAIQDQNNEDIQRYDTNC